MKILSTDSDMTPADAGTGMDIGRNLGNERLTRLYIIDRFLCEHGPATAADIMRRLQQSGKVREISRRTLYDDLDFLQTIDSSHVDLVSTDTKPRLYSITDNKGLFRCDYKQDELHLLEALFRHVGEFIEFSDSGKVRELIETQHLDVPTRRIVDLGVMPFRDRQIFNDIYSAIADRSVVELRYRPMAELNAGTPTRTVHFKPYRMKHHDGRWTLIGAVEDDDFLCTFYLDQIESVEPVTFRDKTFARVKRQYHVREPQRVDEVYADVVGITVPRPGTPLCEVVFAAMPERANHIATFPFVHNQKELEGADADKWLSADRNLPSGTRIFSMTAYDTPDLHRAILSRGEAIVVLAPESLRKTMADSISAMSRLYLSGNSDE